MPISARAGSLSLTAASRTEAVARASTTPGAGIPRRVVVAGDRGVGGAGAVAQLLGVAEPRRLHAQHLVLPRPGVERLDPFEADPQGLGLSRSLGRGGAQVGELGLGLAQLGVDDAVGGEVGGQGRTAERVEHLAVLVGAAQPPLVGLAVHRDEVLGELTEQPDGRGPTADVGPRAAVGRHRAHEDEPVGDVGAGLGRTSEGGVALGEVEHALDDGTVGAGAHEPGVAAPTEQQAQPGDDHRLAGAGLAGEHREPAVERQGGVVDDAEVPDADLLDHAVAAVAVGLLAAGGAAPALHRQAGTSRRAGR